MVHVGADLDKRSSQIAVLNVKPRWLFHRKVSPPLRGDQEPCRHHQESVTASESLT